MPFERVERRSLSSEVFDQLVDEIVRGRLSPGDALPGERQLTEAFGVNRQAVREALQRLQQLGLVGIQQGGATRVHDFHRTAGLDLLAHLLVDERGVDRTAVRSLMEMRAAVGPDVARLCALRATPDVVTRLVAAVDDLAAATGPADRAAADERFWDALADGSDNVAYRLCLNSLRAVYRPVEGVVHALLADELGDVRGHRAISDAVRAGDAPAAERAARRLLGTGTAAMNAALSGAPTRTTRKGRR